MVTVFVKALSYLLSYIGGNIKSYIFIIIFGLITAVVIDTNLESLFVRILSITPGIGLGKGGAFEVGRDGVLLFFLVWGLIFTVISEILKKITKIKRIFSYKHLLLFGLGLHLISFIIFGIRFNFGFSFMFVGLLFLGFLTSLLFLRILNVFKDLLNKRLARN